MMLEAAIIAILLVFTPLQGAIERADQLFSYGEHPARDREALAALEAALATDGDNYELLWRVARACYYAGEEAQGEQKTDYYARGIAAGERAIARAPNSAEGHFWLGANYGGWSEQKGVFKALRMIGKIRAEMEAVVRIAPGYEDAKAYLALAELDRQLPRLLGGSNARAIRYAEQGLKLAPRNLELKLSLARSYRAAGRKSEARRLLEEILAQSIDPKRARAERGLQEEARALLGKL